MKSSNNRYLGKFSLIEQCNSLKPAVEVVQIVEHQKEGQQCYAEFENRKEYGQGWM